MTESWSRAQPRTPSEKVFAVNSGQVAGQSNGKLLDSYPNYKDAKVVADQCHVFAKSYALTMVQRVLEEQPDFLEEKQTTFEEFTAHLQNNLCLGAIKHKSAMFKETSAQIAEDGFLNDKIRRLTNGGDKFHPYL